MNYRKIYLETKYLLHCVTLKLSPSMTVVLADLNAVRYLKKIEKKKLTFCPRTITVVRVHHQCTIASDHVVFPIIFVATTIWQLLMTKTSHLACTVD